MKVFLSWSGPISYRVAAALSEWLPCVIQGCRPFLSSEDIAKGERWNDALARELDTTDFGIICLTRYNADAPWLNFESGALSKAIDRSRVVPFLFGIERSRLSGPMAQFQSMLGTKPEALELVSSMNKWLDPEHSMPEDVLELTFSKWWPDLKSRLDKIPVVQEGSTESGIDWLYNPGELARMEIRREIKSIWVVTPYPSRDLQRTCVRDMIKHNIKREVKYTFVVPRSEDSEEVAGNLEQMFAGYPHLLNIEPIEPEEFNSLAVTHYLVLNPDQFEEYNPEVLLELPIAERDHWIRVSADAAFGFTNRFHKMISDSRARRGQSEGLPRSEAQNAAGVATPM